MLKEWMAGTVKVWILAHLYPLIMIGVALLVIGYVITQIGGCIDDRAAEKERKEQQQLNNNIQQNIGAANQIEKDKEEKQNVANQTAVNSAAANSNFERERGTDTSRRDPSAINAIREFCTDHPKDSACSNR